MKNSFHANQHHYHTTTEAHSRHALAGLLWGDVPEDKAKNSLRVTLAALCKVCPDHLDITHLTIGIHADSDLWLDVNAFAAGLENTADLPTRQQTLDLYRGDFLEDMHVSGPPAFEEWLLTQRNEAGVFGQQMEALWRQNPCLHFDSEASFCGYVGNYATEVPAHYIDIKRINSGLLNADEARLEELELGKNLCALLTH